jgi:hypothetical protein
MILVQDGDIVESHNYTHYRELLLDNTEGTPPFPLEFIQLLDSLLIFLNCVVISST